MKIKQFKDSKFGIMMCHSLYHLKADIQLMAVRHTCSDITSSAYL